MRQTILRSLIFLVPLTVAIGALRAADATGAGSDRPANDSLVAAKPSGDSLTTINDSTSSKTSKTSKISKDSKTTVKDPIASTFALPKHLTVEQLRPDQQQAYNKLKDKMQPKLQEALDKKDKTTDENDKNTAAREVMKLQKEIKADIQAILNQPAPTAKQQQPAVAKKPQHKHRRR
jgi:hypothetical protein